MYCRRIQHQIHRLIDKGSALPAAVQKHLDQCPSCRDFYEMLLQVDLKLRRDHPTLPVLDTAELQRRIVVDLRRDRFLSVHPKTPWRILRFRPIAAAVLLIASVSLLFWIQNHRSLHSPVAGNTPSLNYIIPSDLYLFQNPLPLHSFQHPLETEMNRLAQDMQTAVQFVSNCLPQTHLDIHQP